MAEHKVVNITQNQKRHHSVFGTAPHCPNCLAKLDGWTRADTGAEPVKVPQPKAGDLSVCCYCASYLQYTEEGTLIEAPTGALDQLAPAARQVLEDCVQEFQRRLAQRRS